MNFPVPSQLAGTFLCPALMQSQFGKAQTGRDDALAAVGADAVAPGAPLVHEDIAGNVAVSVRLGNVEAGREPIPGVAGPNGCRHPTRLPTLTRCRKCPQVPPS